MEQQTGKTVKESALIRKYQLLPSDLNPLGVLYGGRFVYIIDALAARVARTHSGKTCVTASMDRIDFLAPALLDETLIIKIAVNRAWTTSMEIGIKVLVKRNSKPVHIASAYLTFVAIDEKGKPTAVPPLIPQTPNEKRRFREAEKRREIRLANRKR